MYGNAVGESPAAPFSLAVPPATCIDLKSSIKILLPLQSVKIPLGVNAANTLRILSFTVNLFSGFKKYYVFPIVLFARSPKVMGVVS